MKRRIVDQANMKTAADFFAGIGLVSMGLDQAGWQTIYALDYDLEKAAAYTNHFGADHYIVKDVSSLNGQDVPEVMLAHASFPCTDLSVAGARKGINHGESSSFWHFVRIISEMKQTYRESSPPFILLENVEGLLTSANGDDLKSALLALNKLNYRVDLLRIDASHFVPQSRVRIFIVGVHKSVMQRFDLHALTQIRNLSSSNARPKKIIEYVTRHPEIQWYFHEIPHLPNRQIFLDDIIDLTAVWAPKEKTEYMYNQMHSYHKQLIDRLIGDDNFHYFPAFRRTRERDGKRQATVELRTDGIAGCLRTPKGGSARQILIRVGKGGVDTRLINEKEAAHLMGASKYRLNPDLSLNQVLFGFGDAVCVPAVEWLATNYLNELTDLIA